MATQVITHGRVTWTHIEHPTAADIAALAEAYPHFHPLDLEDTLSPIERSKIDEYDDYLFVVMHFPTWDSNNRVSRASEVDMFIGSGYLVTVCNGPLKPLNRFFEQCLEDEVTRERYMNLGASRILHSVIDRMVDSLFPILHKVDHNIRNLEDNIFTKDTRWTIQEITFLRRDIIALRRIIRPQIPIVRDLEAVDRPFIIEDLDVYFGDILDHLQKARDMLDDHAQVTESLADTTDALASYRINDVMRILTVISVIMLPLSLIASVYGMNIQLPFDDHPNSFFIIAGFMLVIASSMLLYFRWRRWL